MVTHHKEMCRIVKDYFTRVFGNAELENEMEIDENVNIISPGQNEALTEAFTYDEFTNAIRKMHPDKASGPDRLNPTFFQHLWSPMGHELFLCCQEWLNNFSFPAELNDTNVDSKKREC